MNQQLLTNMPDSECPSCPLTLVEGIEHLHAPARALWVIRNGSSASLVPVSSLIPAEPESILGVLPALTSASLGDRAFCQEYGVKMAYYAGAMAKGIHSEAMTTALGQQRILGIFGSGGLSIRRISDAINHLKQHLPNGIFGINLLHNPANPQWEMDCVRLCIDNQVTIIEASAYINLSIALVYYRASGLYRDESGKIRRKHRLIAKVSRSEVAQRFLSPAPEALLQKLLTMELINSEQAELARRIPVADDITVEGDSGGHTDNGVLSCIFPEIVQLRDEAEVKSGFRVRIGAAGGLGTPEAVLAAFNMGAAYVVTGSVNQSCVEADLSVMAKRMLEKARTGDVTTAPSADMFASGAKVQVLRQGSMYAVRAHKLYALYKQYENLQALPEKEHQILEKQIFQKPLTDIWQETEAYFQRNHLSAFLETLAHDPRKKMVTLFQWYLGQSSQWAISGEASRQADFQIWCGPALGAMNSWLAGTPLEDVMQRKVADIACLLMDGAARLARNTLLEMMGISVPVALKKDVLFMHPAFSLGDRQIDNGIASARNSASVDRDTTQYPVENFNKNAGVAVASVQGSFIVNSQGKTFLDLACHDGAGLVGHGNVYFHTLLNQYSKQPATRLAMDVCDTLIRNIPCAELVHFSSHEGEAIQRAYMLAQRFTGKKGIIHFGGHPHNSSLSNEKINFLLPWNNIVSLSQTLAGHHHKIAAVVMEPICISGGGILPEPNFLVQVKALCEQHNIVLIFDEVTTGVRLALGGAQQLLGVSPHLSILGKALGGGDIAAVVGKREIMQICQDNQKDNTDFCERYCEKFAAVKATYTLIEQEPECYERMGTIAASLANVFIDAAKAADLPLVIQGMPTALAWHSQTQPVDSLHGLSNETKRCDAIIHQIAKRYGILFAPLSTLYSNLLMSQNDIDFFASRILDVMKASHQTILQTYSQD